LAYWIGTTGTPRGWSSSSRFVLEIATDSSEEPRRAPGFFFLRVDSIGAGTLSFGRMISLVIKIAIVGTAFLISVGWFLYWVLRIVAAKKRIESQKKD